MDQFIGEIKMVGFNFAPQGYAFCDGTLLSVAQNSALFALLKTLYGGNGVSTFGLPDYRGRSPVGMGKGPAMSHPIAQGEQAGVESTVLLQSNMPSHTHPVLTNDLRAEPLATTVGPNTPTAESNVVANTGEVWYNEAASANVTMAPIPITGQITIGMAGGNLPVNLRNPYLGTNFVIALTGIFPSQG